MISKNNIILAFTFFLNLLTLNLVFADNAPPTNNVANPDYLPFLAGPISQNLMAAPAKTTHSKTVTYILPGTSATTQWGVFDNKQSPVLRVNSGDTIVFETLAAADNQVVPGVDADKIHEMNNAVKNRGPHTLTGPVYINGAEPGDVLRIHINRIIPRPYASNDSLPGKGLLPEEFPVGQVKYFYIDTKKKEIPFAPGIVVPLRPFPGVVAVASAQSGPISSGPPGNFGGNMDLREMVEGTTLYLPVFVKGALLWTGDSHAAQGNGEIDLTAMETAYTEFNVTVDVIKNKSLDRPLVETPTNWITVGYNADLNKALDSLKTETVKFIMQERNVSQNQAENILYATWNCPIAEVVNGVQGAYCMIPKNNHAATPAALPTQDNNKMYVTYAKNPDIEKAMKQASSAMIKKIATEKNMPRLDVYALLSVAMDCRIAPYHSGDKEVHCMLDKDLWTIQK